jgi:D-alanyl-D-alanine carboxypeptidase/D-alanyl-D-alanine-endopeptidase (penicillin-binding protein 4)
MPARFLACLWLALAAAPAAAELPQPMLDRLRGTGIPEEAVGVVVQRVSDGRLLVAHGADRALAPASTLKLLTSLAALETLGPAYRLRTELLTRGEPVDGVLGEDLVLRGGGDVDFDAHAFEHVLRIARMQGIRELRGDLVLDRRLFDPPRTDVGVPPFDEAPEFRYNVIPDAMLVNTNLVHLDMVSDGRSVRVESTPPLEGVTLQADFKLVERDCKDWEDGWIAPEVRKGAAGSIRIRLQGEFPRHCTAETAVNVLDRMVFVDRLFRATWKSLGGTFSGRTREGEAPPAARLIAEHASRTLAELMRDVNKASDNPNTRIVYLALGASAGAGTGLPTAQLAEREVRAWMQRHGIDPEGLVLENGSGLSRKERIRPSQLAAVLRVALTSPWMPEFTASLPIVATDGSMRKRLRSSQVAGRARIKTGTLRDSSAVAGYVTDEAGETYIVAAIINHEAAVKGVARPVLDALLEWVGARGRAGTRP